MAGGGLSKSQVTRGNLFTLHQRHNYPLTRTLSVRISSWRVCLACFEGTFSNFIRAFSARISSWRVCSVEVPVPLNICSAQASVPCERISSQRVCSVHASVPYEYAESIQNEHLKNGKTDAHTEHARNDWMRLLRVRISPDAYAQRVHISSWHECSACTTVPDTNAQRAHQFLTRSLSVCTSVPDTNAQRGHKGRSMRVKKSIFLIIFKVPKIAKN